MIRGDNTARIASLNRWIANRSALRTVLRVGYETCQRTDTRVWGVHVAGVDNIEADGLSRSEQYVLCMEKSGYQRVEEPAELSKWLSCILVSAKDRVQHEEEITDTEEEELVEGRWMK